MRKTLIVLATVLCQRRLSVSCLDLRLDIAGGTCHNTTEFDETFDDGIMPGTQEVMDVTTETLDDNAVRKYGFSAFRGGDMDQVVYQTGPPEGYDANNYSETESLSLSGHRDTDHEFGNSTDGHHRDLQIFDCPVFKDCPGAGDPSHWCAWICGYWTTNRPPAPKSKSSSAEPQRRDNDGGFLRRVTEDLRIPDAELQETLEQLQHQPIRYTPEDRQLWISIEGIVCGWIQRWMDSRLSDCLHGATLMVCELNLRS